MTSHWYRSRWTAAVPFALVLLLVLVYVSSQAAFVECNAASLVTCKRAGIGALFELDASVRLEEGRLVVAAPVAANPARRQVVADSLRLAGLKTAVRRFNGRFVWTFFVGVGLFASLAALGTAALLLTTPPGEPGTRYGVRLVGVLAPSVAFGAWMHGNPGVHMNLMKEVLERSVDADGSFGVQSGMRVMNFVNSLDLSVSTALVLACCLMLLPSGAPGAAWRGTELDGRLRPVLHRMRTLRAFLYVGTALLVIGVLRMQSVVDWVVTFVRPADGAVLATTGMTLSWVMGAFYSLVLAAVYLPSAYILRARAAAEIEESSAPEEAKVEAASRAGLSQSPGEAVPRIAALLGPLLAGPIGNLLQTFTQ